MNRLKTVFSVQINAQNTLEFVEEGSVSVTADHSLVYLADGATLVVQQGKVRSFWLFEKRKKLEVSFVFHTGYSCARRKLWIAAAIVCGRERLVDRTVALFLL